ncbi:uncharacterized protein PV07_00273 [Cladophialophora immunda]|uniref:Uncharacterized protein n=1 Tax=Cladophialophora immunda TaxID=569365 RepID=A0A0D1ZZ65_9EURO|nr:uncharacterized protein PV07_00273 [Cladophialophora immunda]KIW33421.1 hypothetical protein PV07_00273 [Cladophialophora immunda]
MEFTVDRLHVVGLGDTVLILGAHLAFIGLIPLVFALCLTGDILCDLIPTYVRQEHFIDRPLVHKVFYLMILLGQISVFYGLHNARNRVMTYYNDILRLKMSTVHMSIHPSYLKLWFWQGVAWQELFERKVVPILLMVFPILLPTLERWFP